MSTIFVFILQVATVSVGRPTPTSPFQQVRQTLFSASTFKTVFWYLLSAWWFTEVYIWLSSDMTWVTRENAASQAALNERPIYFRALFSMLAVVQAGKHVYYGQAVLNLPVAAPGSPQDKMVNTHTIPDTFSYFKSQARDVLLRSIVGSITATILCPFIYTAFLRTFLWKVHLSIAKVMYSMARSSARPSGLPPVGTFATTIWIGFILSLTWELAAISLIAYFRKPPIKEAKPWTSSGKDPNGSLLNGLKAKRGIIKTFAFWELAIIAQSHPERRKLIFSDIDRPTGPIWSQMLQEALKVLQQIDDRIQPPQPAAPVTQEPASTLPKILKPPRESTKAKEQQNIVAQRASKDARARQRLVDIADEKLKLLGSNPDPFPILDVPDTATLISTAKNSFSTFFSSTPESRINATVLGSPHSDAATIVDAIEAVTRMLIASLQEDNFGKAMAGVPLAVKQFTKTITLIEGLLSQQQEASDLTDVNIILSRLKSGLLELLTGFQMYLGDSALGIADLNAAKKASGQLAAEEEEQKRIQAAPSRRELLDLQDAPTPAAQEERRPDEGWREWSKPKKATTKLFPQYEENPRPRRQVSGSRRQNGHAQRPREMEQVR
jgi:nucleoporin NDC1